MSKRFIDPKSLSKNQLENGTQFAPAFNAQGLIVAIACDATTDEILMVAHMNQEALGLTLDTGEVHYYSRSRAKLWKKGETSGEIQKLVEIHTDCDQDVLRLRVEQAGRGAACHTGHKSCFYRKLDMVDANIQLRDDTAGVLFDPAKVYSS